jgi:hypothetical protein
MTNATSSLPRYKVEDEKEKEKWPQGVSAIALCTAGFVAIVAHFMSIKQ